MNNLAEPKQRITVQDIIYAIMEFYHKEAITLEKVSLALFPSPYMPVWHKFFYHLKKTYAKKFPELEIDFDWDGPFPKSPQVQEAVDAMFTRCCTPILHENRMILWTKKQSNPLLEFNLQLHDLIMSEADIYEGLLDYHPLPF